MRKSISQLFALLCLVAAQCFSQSLPVIQSMSPGGSGASVNYSVTAAFTSPSNALQVQIRFGDVVGGCSVLFQFTTNAVFLLSSDASTWGPGYQMGSGGTQSNPQCNFANASAGYTFSGNTATPHVTLNFLPAFAGSRAISAQAYSVDGTTSAWASASSPWVVPGGSSGPPVVNSVYSGAGSSQVTRQFTIFGTDTAGSSNTMYMWPRFGEIAGGCNLLFEPNLNRVSLLNDAGTSWGTPMTLGGGGTLENSQCSFPLSTATRTLYTNGVTEASAVITFKPAFGGVRPIWGIIYGYNGLNSGWSQYGTWTVPGGNVDISLTAVEINNHEMLLDDATGQYVEKPTSGNPWVVQLKNGGSVRVPAANNVVISNLSHNWEPIGDEYNYHFKIDTTDNPYIMRLGLIEDEITPLGEMPKATKPEGWLSMDPSRAPAPHIGKRGAIRLPTPA